MASYNGLVGLSSTTSEVLFGASFGSYKTNVVASVPAKWFKRAALSVQTYGLSGTLGLEVVGSIGGATFVVAGATAIGTSSTLMLSRASDIPWGATASGVNSVPRPSYIQWQPGADGTSFSAAVFIAGDY